MSPTFLFFDLTFTEKDAIMRLNLIEEDHAMKITFLGTSHGVPEKGRLCTCTMIEAGNSIYFVDAGVPIVNALIDRDRGVKDVRALFTTHVHGDHTAGLFQFADLVDWYYREHSMDFYIADEVLIDALKTMIQACNGGNPVHEDRLHFHVIDPQVAYEDENIKVEFIPTKHMARVEGYHSYAMLVTEGEHRVLFSGDLSHQLALGDVPEILSKEPIDAFICEMAHFYPEHIQPYLETCKAKAVYFHHINSQQKKMPLVRALNGKFDFPVYVPDDGDSFEV